MKKAIWAFLFVSTVFLSCQSSKSLLRSGQYDRAIDRSVHKLRKNSTNQKEIPVLEEAYNKAMDADSLRIIFLKKEGRPDNWDEIYSLYSGMKSRQDKVRPLPMLRITDKKFKTLHVVDFHFRSYDEELMQSKQKAADYFYAHAISLLEKGNRVDAQNAFSDLEKVKEFYPDYKDVNDQMKKAREMGTSHVLLKVKNETRVVIPKDLEQDLLKISPGGLNEKWVRFYSSETKDINYDFFVLIRLKFIDVTPESVKESRFSETREVQDGWQYVKDSRGNVMKDTLGNDIKVPRMVSVSCTVIETQQRKLAHIDGVLEFIDAGNGSVIRSFPIASDSKFENFCAVPLGDVNALKPESLKRLGGKPMPFPNDLDMISQAGVHLKEMAKNIVAGNGDLLR